jgi:hypothetical protein
MMVGVSKHLAKGKNVDAKFGQGSVTAYVFKPKPYKTVEMV